MKISVLLLSLLLVCTTGSYAQDCLAFQKPFYLRPMTVGETHRDSFRVQNASTLALVIHNTEFINTYLYNSVEVRFLTPTLTIAPLREANIIFDVTPRHNVPIMGRIVFTVQCGEGCAISTTYLTLSSSGAPITYPDTAAYSYTNNLEYNDLYTALQQKVVNHTSLGYKNAREVMFGKADNVNDSVECIYTGRKLKTAGIPPNGEFNTEHTWVQSRGSSTEPNKSDINHLYPTYPNANTIRSNYPFGNVAKLWRDAGGGSRLGFTTAGDTVFEPRDVSKGNIARSIFYYLVRYGNLTDYYTSPYKMDATLRQWNIADPPDARERTRCDTIAAYQGKRNPFVDHPELVERLEFVDTPHPDAVRFVQRRLVYDPGVAARIDCHLINRWNRKILVNKIWFSEPSYFYGNLISSDSIDEHSFEAMDIRYTPRATPPPIRTYCILSFSNGGSDTLFLDNCALADAHEQIPAISTTHPTISVSPHPVEDVSTVECALNKEHVLRVALFSLEGREVADISSRIIPTTKGIALQLNKGDTEFGGRVIVLRIYTQQGVISRIIVTQ